MKHLNHLYLFIFSVFCLTLAACESSTGYSPSASTVATAGPSPLSSAQVANGTGTTTLSPGTQTVTGASTQQQPLTGFEQVQGTGSLASPGQAPVAFPVTPAAPVKIAVLLPLSGKDAALGQAMLQSAQMALFDIGENAFEIMPRDTAGGARNAAQSAIAEGAKLILGPVFAADVREAKAVAQSAGINMIAFSTDWTLAGGNTFIMGFMPFDQTTRVIDYMRGRGANHIGAITPSSQYANAVINTFRNKMGTSVIATDVATINNTSDIPATVQNFAKQATMPFDAVLLPIGGTNAIAVADALTQNGMPPERVRRIGTGLWEDPSLATAASLQGALFAAPAPAERQKFESRYNQLYSAVPPRLASLAYDATALAAVLARSGNFDRAAITNPNGFTGVDGIFRFRNDGLAERGLAVLELKNGKINLIEPAPRTFQSQMN